MILVVASPGNGDGLVEVGVVLDEVSLLDLEVDLELLALAVDHPSKESGLRVGELKSLILAQLELALVGEPGTTNK